MEYERAGAARRRRERRLRSWWRHERMSIAMALATVEHHSCGPTAYDALRGQRTVTRAGEVEERVLHVAPRRQEPPPPGTRPTPLVEVQPQGAMVQHSGIFELEQILDVPVLQVVEQPEEVVSFFRNSVPAVAEQVIEVPKLSLPVCAVQRAALPEPQLVEQLVEVPTVLTYSLLKQRTAEQVVDTPVPHGRGRGARGGLQGSSQGQGSTAVCGADEVVSPSLHARGGSRGGLQGLSQGQGSTAFCGADNVVSPSLHARGGFRGGLQGSSQGPGSTAVCGADNVVSSASQCRGGGARGGLPGLSQGQGSSAVCGAEHVDTPVSHSRVGKRGLQRFPRGQSSTASAFEQNFSQAPHPSLPQAPVHGRHDEWVCVVVENDNEYYWNRWDNTTCWRLPRGVKHRWCRLPSGLFRDVVLGEEFWDLPPL